MRFGERYGALSLAAHEPGGATAHVAALRMVLRDDAVGQRYRHVDLGLLDAVLSELLHCHRL